MVSERENAVVTPWWVRANAPWSGTIMEQMVLKDEDPREGRIQRIRQRLIGKYSSGKYRLSAAQAVIVTRSYQETEGLHPAIRRALAAKKVMSELPIQLMDEQLLMGTASSGPNIIDFNPFFLPIDPIEWEEKKGLAAALDEAEKRYVFLPEDRRLFDEVVYPYWKDRAREFFFFNELKTYYPDAWDYLIHADAARYSPLIGGGLAHSIQDYRSILQKGLLTIKEEIRQQISTLTPAEPGSLDVFERRNLYEAMLIAADAVMIYAERCANLAESLALRETDSARAAELREMARICHKVPAHPAENWWEALQSFHFLRLATAMLEGADSHSAGRFDQYMLPFLLDGWINQGKDPGDAQELLECLFLKWNETRAFKLKLSVGSAGGGNNDKINIGGINEFGDDCTNQLSYMLLEAHAHVHMVDPNLSVRLHRNTPRQFLEATLEVVRLGGGLPILINDEVIVPALIANCGIKLEHARNYGDVGCQENVVDPNSCEADSNGRNNSGWVNLVKPIELALHNGVNPRNGVQVGPKTGDPREFSCMEHFVEAVKIQIEHAVRMNVIINNVYDWVYARFYPCVFHDLMYPGPRRTGLDINAGGCTYNWTGCLAVGTANAGDILAAVDTLIFREKTITWQQLMDALDRNWEGYEDVRKLCLKAPKYGCDEEYADHWVRKNLSMWVQAYRRHTTPRGGRFVVGLISMGNYVTLGKAVGATPDGRKKGDPLSDSTSPSTLAKVNGPTAAHRSAARAIDAVNIPNGVTFNQRFNYTVLSSRRDLSKWADLVKSYMDDGGMEVQYTIVDENQLRDAQLHPERYRDLIVRVGGYSAYFVELTKEVQDSIIARSELAF